MTMSLKNCIALMPMEVVEMKAIISKKLGGLVLGMILLFGVLAPATDARTHWRVYYSYRRPVYYSYYYPRRRYVYYYPRGYAWRWHHYGWHHHRDWD